MRRVITGKEITRFQERTYVFNKIMHVCDRERERERESGRERKIQLERRMLIVITGKEVKGISECCAK